MDRVDGPGGTATPCVPPRSPLPRVSGWRSWSAGPAPPTTTRCARSTRSPPPQRRGRVPLAASPRELGEGLPRVPRPGVRGARPLADLLARPCGPAKHGLLLLGLQPESDGGDVPP